MWITKYALSSGIYEANGEVSDISSSMFVPDHSPGSFVRPIHTPHWHATREAAVAQVRKMIAAKRKSIKKQLAKLDEIEKGL